MGVKRGPDGVPIDVPSVMHERSKESGGKPSRPSSLFGDDDATIPPSGSRPIVDEDKTMPPPGKRASGLFPEDPPTVPAGAKAASAPRRESRSDDPPTVIAGGSHRRNTNLLGEVAGEERIVDAMSDPVVGWLVVVDGPGKGSFLKLGNGQNSIGRSKEQRVCIDFGDDQISRQNHATVTFDPRGKNFYVQQGSGANLAYLNDQPVLSVTSLSAMSRISIGNTTLLFVPLCGNEFSWN